MTLVIPNPEFVTSVMRDARVWKWVMEDGIRPEQFSYNPNATYFQHQDRGFVMFRKVTNRMQEIHIAMLRGVSDLPPFIYDCLAEMRNRGTKKFLAPIGSWNIPAMRLAKKCGFIEEGRVFGAYTRNGIPHAMVLLGAE